VAVVGLGTVPSHTVKPPRIARAPVAFECMLHEKMETESRYVFFGRVQWMAAREGLIDTELWRVNLRDYDPVARFGASFYIRCTDRYAMADQGAALSAQGAARAAVAVDSLPSTETPIDRL
jgi:flavin reductase (DIM6/NTAB) family NADH-FMN oxidoreductase RutF